MKTCKKASFEEALLSSIPFPDALPVWAPAILTTGKTSCRKVISGAFILSHSMSLPSMALHCGSYSTASSLIWEYQHRGHYPAPLFTIFVNAITVTRDPVDCILSESAIYVSNDVVDFYSIQQSFVKSIIQLACGFEFDFDFRP